MRWAIIVGGVGLLAYFYFKSKTASAPAQLGGSGDPNGPDPLGLLNLGGTGVQGANADPLSVSPNGGVQPKWDSSDPLQIGTLTSKVALNLSGNPTFGNG